MKFLLTVAFLVLVLVLVLVQWENVCVSGSDSVQCREEERLALLHIKASISFPIHSLEGKWEGKECCQWERVTCDPITGHVTQLDLGISFDDYDWRDYYYQEGISLNATLFLRLRQLRSLSLSTRGIYNCTDGAGLETWANLTKLEILDLSWNSLDGRMIYDLASVPSLRKLDLSGNYINRSGLLPNIKGFETWSNLTKLEILDLSDNSLDGSIIYNLASVPSLRQLGLSGNHVNNSLPNVNGLETWSNLTKLEILDLSNNSVDGRMIYNLGSVPSLRKLDLSWNNINNSLPNINGLEIWSNLTKLEILDFSYNSLDGRIIYNLASVPSLRKLDLSGNNINNSLPNINGLETWSNLTKLDILDLSYNSLDGSIIYNLASVPSLRKLDLSGNHIDKSLPNINGFEYWSNLTKLEMLDLSLNQLDRS